MSSPPGRIIEIGIDAKYKNLWSRVFRLYRSYLITLTILAIIYGAIQGFGSTIILAWLATNAIGLLISFIDASVMLFKFQYDPSTGKVQLISAHYNHLKEIISLPKQELRAEAKEDAGTRGTRWRLNFFVHDKPIYSQKINRWWNGKKLSEIILTLKQIQH